MADDMQIYYHWRAMMRTGIKMWLADKFSQQRNLYEDVGVQKAFTVCILSHHRAS
jgi:hypothetical protein